MILLKVVSICIVLYCIVLYCIIIAVCCFDLVRKPRMMF